MDFLETDEHIESELFRSEPDLLSESNENEGIEESDEDAVDLIEEEIEVPDIFSPDATDDEYCPSESEEDSSEADKCTPARKRQKKNSNHQIQVNHPSIPSTSVSHSLSDSEEQSLESDQEEPRAADVPSFVIIPKRTNLRGKNKHKWSSVPAKTSSRTPRRNIVFIRPGPKGAAKGVKKEVSAFQLFISDPMIDDIVKFTNEEIAIQGINYSNANFVGPTSPVEIKALFGLYIFFGANSQSDTSTQHLWHELRGLRISKCVMSENRFKFLTNNIRFDDKATRAVRKENDPLAPIRDVWDKFIQNCRDSYTPGAYCAIDEQLLAFRGKCSFKMYIPSKPAKYGLKIVMMCNASNGYLIDAIPYTGKKMNSEGKPKADFFVEKLSQSIQNSNRNITVDNWFSSIPLFKLMLETHSLTMVGTLRKNKPHIPQELIQVKGRKPETSMFAFDKDLTLLSYTPKKNKNVLLLSTMHQGRTFMRGTTKPEIIHFYNGTKGGVDLLDQMSAKYTVSRKTRRWPLCMFYGVLNSACLNAYIIQQDNLTLSQEKVVSRLNFLLTLGEELVKPLMHQRLAIPTLQRSIRLSISQQLGLELQSTQAACTNRTSGRCAFCSRSKDTKTTIKCADCKKFTCKNHAITLCEDCAK